MKMPSKTRQVYKLQSFHDDFFQIVHRRDSLADNIYMAYCDVHCELENTHIAHVRFNLVKFPVHKQSIPFDRVRIAKRVVVSDTFTVFFLFHVHDNDDVSLIGCESNDFVSSSSVQQM